MSLPRELYLAAAVRELDRRAISEHDIPAEELMERAGRALFRALRDRFASASRLLVLCGSGNNGGDGYVLARLAREAGLDVTLAAVSPPGNLAGAALSANHRYVAAGGLCEEFLPGMLQAAEVVVDALLGTGIDRPVTGAMADVIRQVNASGKPVLSADLPSGLNADTGAEMGVAIRAAVTVSFIGLKAGLFTGRGPALAGECLFDALDVPGGVYRDASPFARRLAADDLAGWLPPRSRDAHKGNFGHVLLLGGGKGMPGAVALAGEAALRAGAGRVTAVTATTNSRVIPAIRPELMCRGVDDLSEVETLLEHADVLVAGPGLGQDDWASRLWDSFRYRDHAGRPRVIDADGLNWLARHPLPLTPDDILTPHPGEAARLLDCRVPDIAANRYAAAMTLARRHDCVVLLKGAGTIVAAPDGRLAVCSYGNPGMASAGMGDVLTGIIAAFRGQGLAAFEAAAAGALAHALAGDRAACGGERGTLARDVIGALRAVVNGAAA